ncbi:alpha/beta hydrolase domain-containing protein [Thalassotalea litorea]|uniref:alpha/beta hydrolase domain-containing protein n=1 Tax=Thalassotalea litorea TaxID=2020715 RepID=UPI003736C192
MHTKNPRFITLLIAAFMMVIASPVTQAELVKQTVDSRKEFNIQGETYQAISGKFHFEFDPQHSANQAINDLKLAPTNQRGKVEASANFFIIQAKDPKQRRGALVEVSNRGSKAALRYFNFAQASKNPDRTDLLGDNYIQSLGLSLVWVGWQGDVSPGANVMRADLPVLDGIEGFARSDWTLDTPHSKLSVAHKSGIEAIYPIDLSKKDQAWLTRREGRDNLKVVVSKERWQLTSDGKIIIGDFQPGIYELVYPTRNPQVSGIGLGIIRDTGEYLKNEISPYYAPKTMAFGVSQTGRFLRQFLYQGFNETELGQLAFDGMLVHTAGAGRGSFNHRFAQPSRDGHRMSAFFYPTDIFPFASEQLRSQITRKKDGLLKRYHEAYYPKIFYTNSGYEYWGRAAGLIHSNGIYDVKPLKNERIYHLSSAQHFVQSHDDLISVGEDENLYRGNPINFFPQLRALLGHLSNWVIDQDTPPASQYPSYSNQTLTNFSHYQLPEWLTIAKPYKPHTAYEVDYGKQFNEQGIIDNNPPLIMAEIVPPVPKVDSNGNELGGIRHPLITAPIATFLPWSLRFGIFAGNEMVDFRGSVYKWPKERVLKRYPNKQHYLRHISEMTDVSIKEGFVLPRDKSKIKTQASQFWDWSMATEK